MPRALLMLPAADSLQPGWSKHCAPDIQAGAAEGAAPLDAGNLESQLRRLDCGHIAAGTAADYHHILDALHVELGGGERELALPKSSPGGSPRAAHLHHDPKALPQAIEAQRLPPGETRRVTHSRLPSPAASSLL